MSLENVKQKRERERVCVCTPHTLTKHNIHYYFYLNSQAASLNYPQCKYAVFKGGDQMEGWQVKLAEKNLEILTCRFTNSIIRQGTR